MIHQIEARIFTPVKETEVTDRVVDAVHNVFPTAELRRTDEGLAGETHSLAELSEHLHRREILDTARSEFYENRRRDGFTFTLKKQAAFVGVVTFAVGEPSELGEIDVDVHVIEPDIDSVIDHVAPPTEDGVPITGNDAR